MRKLADLKLRAMQWPGTEIRVGTLRVGYWRAHRGSSPKETPTFHFYQWDEARRGHIHLTEEQAAGLLYAERRPRTIP